LLATLPSIALTLVDGDTVEAGNLVRQPLYGAADVGRLKVEVAHVRLRAIHPGLPVTTVPRFLDPANARELIGGNDVVVDCTDDLHARRLIDKVCGQLAVPLVSGGVHGHQVQVITLHASPKGGKNSSSYSGLFERSISSEQDGCEMRDVPVHVTSLAGAVMAAHVRSLLFGDRSLAGVLELIDTASGRWMRFSPPLPPPDDELIAFDPPEQAHA